jgi:CRP-like cAMP-binding protein
MDTHELAQFSLFDGLTPEQLHLLAPLFRRESFEAGATILKQGERAANLYMLETGEVVIRYRPYDGGSMDLETIKPAGLLGWSAAIGRSEYTSSAICLTPVTVIAIQGRDLRRLMRADKKLRALLSKRMASLVANRLSYFHVQLNKFFDGEEGAED